MHLSISLLFSLLVTATAIADTNGRCKAAVKSATERSRHYNDIMKRQIGYDADWNNWKPEEWKKRWGHTLTGLCSYYTRQYNQAVMDAIAKQLATECTVTDVDYQRSIEFFEYDTILQEAFCYLDADNEFVTLKNAWLPILAYRNFRGTTERPLVEDKYFTCTKGNKHVLGTINDFVNTKQDRFPETAPVWKKIVDDAKIFCGNKFDDLQLATEAPFPDVVKFDDLESAVEAPFPDVQQRWIKEHETLQEFFDTVNKLTGELESQQKKLEDKHEETVKKLTGELESLQKKLQKTESDKKAQEAKWGERLTNLQNQLQDAARQEQLQKKEKAECHLELVEMQRQKLKASLEDLEERLKGDKRLTNLQNQLQDAARREQLQKKEKSDCHLGLVEMQRQNIRLKASLEDLEERLKGDKNSGNIASQTSIPAFFGLLSMAVFARRF